MLSRLMEEQKMRENKKSEDNSMDIEKSEITNKSSENINTSHLSSRRQRSYESLSSSSSEDTNFRDVNTVEAIVNQIVYNDKYQFDESGSPKLNPKYLETQVGMIIDPDTPGDSTNRSEPADIREFKKFVKGLNDFLYPHIDDPQRRYKQIMKHPLVSSYVIPDDYTILYRAGKRKKTQRKNKKKTKKTKSKAKKQSKKSKKSRKSKKRRT